LALVEKWRSELIENYGISEHRLIVITAEAQQSSCGSVETWVVPLGAALPDPNASSEIPVVDGEAIEVNEETQKEF
jgi:hypothetical protein